MTHSRIGPGLPAKAPSTWLVRILAAAFLGLGVLFVLAPWAGSALFGLPVPASERDLLLYPVAIGLRDLAFGLYLLILSFTSSRRTLALVFAATLVIPLGDMAIVAAARGIWSPGPLLLHGLSALVVATTSLWLFRQASHDTTGGPS
jgi:hypothetical protein